MIFPNIFRAALAVVIASYARLRGYRVLASDETAKFREEICDPCEFRVEDQCSICTCFIEAKTRLNTEQCPKRKWFRVWQKR